MSLENDLIDFKNLRERFKSYISDNENSQMLFSGPFGSGKTTFLKDFFLKNENEYEVFHIYPVNYSLHSNSDIYEILKYDLIIELIGKNVFQTEDISELAKYSFVVAKKIDNLFINIISIFSKTGKQLKEVVDLLHNLKNNINELSNPLLEIQSFEAIIDKIKDYEYEDYITSIIKEKIKGLDDSKLKVLIVDDLDRIDPEHLFRIISVFSAHIDHKTNENKFGFDKIIFVGDIENVRGVFTHKYGSSNSFNGFISKLSSRNPFEFDTAKELYIKISEILSHYKFTCKGEKNKYSMFDCVNKNAQQYFIYLIANLIFSKAISLRELMQNRNVSFEIEGDRYIEGYDISYRDFELYIFYKFLKIFITKNIDIIQSFTHIKSRFLPVAKIFSSDYSRKPLISNLSSFPLYILCFDKELIKKEVGFEFDLKIKDLSFKIELVSDFNRRSKFFKLDQSLSNEENLIDITLLAFEKLLQIAVD